MPIPGRYDLTYTPYKAHSEYFWLTDRNRPGGVLAFDPGEGWVEFVDPVTRVELLWTGVEGMEEGVPAGTRPVAELGEWLRGRKCYVLGAPVADVASEPVDDLRYALTEVRRPKDDVEIERMRIAERATRAGHLKLVSLIAAGATERELQVELEAEFFRNGADCVAYESIVATGTHSAVLHFAPTDRALAAGDLLLVDAGGEHRGYASDITRTYAVSGSFTSEQQVLWDAVRNALEAAIAICRPGTEWRDVHRTAALAIGEGLVELGVLYGDVESLFDSGAITLFFPHGVGHMFGLGVRDAGGAVRDREPPAPGFPPIRVDLPLQERFAMTVEPGVYFVRPLLADRPVSEGIDWDRVEQLLDFGGIRLEENVLITSDGCDVLTSDVPLAP